MKLRTVLPTTLVSGAATLGVGGTPRLRQEPVGHERRRTDGTGMTTALLVDDFGTSAYRVRSK